MNNANSVNGMDAIADIMMVTWMEVGSYGALNNGRKGMGKRAHSQRPLTTHNNFHLLLALSFRNVDKEVICLEAPFDPNEIDLNSRSLTWLLAAPVLFDASSYQLPLALLLV